MVDTTDDRTVSDKLQMALASTLREVAHRLHTATEELNEKLKDIEDFLFERKKIPASREAVDLDENTALTWDGEFFIILQRQPNGSLRRQPLLSSSRAIRVEAAGRIGDLLQKIGIGRT